MTWMIFKVSCVVLGVNPSMASAAAGYNPVLALGIFLVQVCLGCGGDSHFFPLHLSRLLKRFCQGFRQGFTNMHAPH
jgi:hypothetical protein